MASLYRKFDTNILEKENLDIERIEVLSNLKDDCCKISENEHFKIITCANGVCSLFIENIDEAITLNSSETSVYLDKKLNFEIKDYNDETKIIIQYLLEGENYAQ